MLGGCVPSPWEDFQSSCKVLAIGICHLPSSSNLGSVSADFVPVHADEPLPA
jgi:trafficking protein particle complex subunit 9